MRARRSLAAILIIGTWAVATGGARADAVLYDQAGLIQGQQSFVQSFDITSPGTLTVSLSSIPWLDTIADLTCFLTTSSGLVGGSMTSGIETVNVEPGMIYAHWFGDAAGVFGVGAYGLKVEFQPNSAAVPLPASLVLLISGLGILFGWQIRGEPGREAA